MADPRVLHKPRNRAVVTIDGRDYYLGPYNSPQSKAEYDRLIALWLANGRRMPADDPDDLTIDQVIAALWRHAKVYYVKTGKPTNEQATVKVALKVLRRFYGPTLVRNFGPLKLKLVREAMIEQGWCRNHINKQISRLKSVFKWAVAEELVPASVHQGLVAVTGLPGGQWVKPRWRWPLKCKKKQHVRAPVDGGSGQAISCRPGPGPGSPVASSRPEWDRNCYPAAVAWPPQTQGF